MLSNQETFQQPFFNSLIFLLLLYIYVTLHCIMIMIDTIEKNRSAEAIGLYANLIKFTLPFAAKSSKKLDDRTADKTKPKTSRIGTATKGGDGVNQTNNGTQLSEGPIRRVCCH